MYDEYGRTGLDLGSGFSQRPRLRVISEGNRPKVVDKGFPLANNALRNQHGRARRGVSVELEHSWEKEQLSISWDRTKMLHF